MRVALVILHADPSRGGAERYTLDLAASLRGRGHDVEVVDSASLGVRGMTRLGRYRDFCRRLRGRLGLSTSPGAWHKPRRHATPAEPRRSPDHRRVPTRLASEGRPDVVHAMLPVPAGCCDVYHPHAGVEAAGVGRLTWLTNPRRAAMARAERGLLNLEDDTRSRGLTARRSGRGPKPDLRAVSPRLWKSPVVITLSDYVAGILHSHYPRARTRRVFNAVDLQRFRPDGPTVDLGPRPVALFVGNDFERKGLATTVEAVKRSPPWRLAVAGRGRATAAERVDFLGPREDLPALYRSADVLVHASRHDPCSLAALEALASGLPVIGTDRDGATETMVDGRHGFVLRGRDAGAMAQRLGELLDPARRDRMREACLELRSALSWEAHVDRVLDVYEVVKPTDSSPSA